MHYLLTISAAPEEAFDFFSQLVQMICTLALVLGLLFAMVWFLKRLMRARGRAAKHTTAIHILERKALSAKSTLYLVDVLGKGVLLADSPQGLRCIAEFPEGVCLETLLEERMAAPPESTTSNKNALGALIARWKQTPNTEENKSPVTLEN